MSTFTNQSETGRTVDRLSRGRKQLLEAAAVAIGVATVSIGRLLDMLSPT